MSRLLVCRRSKPFSCFFPSSHAQYKNDVTNHFSSIFLFLLVKHLRAYMLHTSTNLNVLVLSATTSVFYGNTPRHPCALVLCASEQVYADSSGKARRLPGKKRTGKSALRRNGAFDQPAKQPICLGIHSRAEPYQSLIPILKRQATP
jgi:hypothetical protein